MRGANLPTGSTRHFESGLVWVEKITGAQSSIRVPEYSTIRVRGSAGTTVTLTDDAATPANTSLCCTLALNEVIFICVGARLNTIDATVVVTIGGANGWVSVGKE